MKTENIFKLSLKPRNKQENFKHNLRQVKPQLRRRLLFNNNNWMLLQLQNLLLKRHLKMMAMKKQSRR